MSMMYIVFAARLTLLIFVSFFCEFPRINWSDLNNVQSHTTQITLQGWFFKLSEYFYEYIRNVVLCEKEKFLCLLKNGSQTLLQLKHSW